MPAVIGGLAGFDDNPSFLVKPGETGGLDETFDEQDMHMAVGYLPLRRKAGERARGGVALF